MSELRIWLRANTGMLIAVALFVAMFTLFISNHPAGLTVPVVNTAANKGVLAAIIAMAQTVPILTAGLDLSVGFIVVMTNSIASQIVHGTPFETALGILGVLAAGAAAGALNGAIVVFGRLQPIIVTLATGAIYYGFALIIRPLPGGSVQPDLADFMTYVVFGAVPTSLLYLLGIVVLVWAPFRLSVIGRGCYAAGSHEGAAYLSGVRIGVAKLVAYTLAGVLAALAGLMLTFITFSGEASFPQGANHTLSSIAAVVVGGTSLFGGVGGAIGSIFGAFVLKTIDDLLFVFDLPALWQPLFQGVVLLLAVSLGAARVLRIRNRLELFG